MNNSPKFDAKADRARQRELKARYLEILAEEVYPSNPEMVEYSAKGIARVVLLTDGSMTAIWKQKIETRFCFGEGSCGMSYEEANAAAAAASRSEKYFKMENLKAFDSMIEQLQSRNVYTRVQYWSSPENSLLKALELACPWETVQGGCTLVAEEDRQRLIDAYILERAAFDKRLNSYLKRYGTSKLHTWTYWVDA